MRKYIIYQAEDSDIDQAPYADGMLLQHTQACTGILEENWDFSDKPIPKPGDRSLEFIRVEASYDPQKHGHSTHYRQSDWEVTRVECYTPQLTTQAFDLIVLCYCRYAPISASLKPMPNRIISADAFTSETEYQQWLDSQPATVSEVPVEV
jgi:hypothetical protein